MRSRLLLPLVALLGLSLTACTTTAEPDVVPSSPSVSPSIETSGNGPVLKEVAIPGLDYGVNTTEARDYQLHVRWAIIPGAEALNRAVEGLAKEREAAFRADTKPQEMAPPELNVASTPFLAKGEVAGVRVEEAVFYGANWGYTGRSFYGSADGRWVASGSELFTEEGAEGAITALLAALPQADKTLEADLKDRKSLLKDAIVQTDGSVLVAVDQGLVGPSSAGTLSAILPADKVRTWLSPRGRDVVMAATQGGAYAVPSPSPTPSPSSATPTPRPPAPSPSPTGGGGGGGAIDCAALKCVALTYDDGPSTYTNQLLDHLAAAQVPATLFVVGQNVARGAATLKRADAQGVEVANHTWSHRDLAKLGADDARSEIEQTQEAIQAAIGKRPTLLRPPYGSYGPGTRQLGLPLILWDVDTLDWQNRNADTTTQRALATVRPGSIILMHDIHPSSVAATPGIIAELKNRGFTLVTISQLVGTPAPGAVVSRLGG